MSTDPAHRILVESGKAREFVHVFRVDDVGLICSKRSCKASTRLLLRVFLVNDGNGGIGDAIFPLCPEHIGQYVHDAPDHSETT